MAALTRSGARKASEIVMLTFRTLQPSRPAMLSVFAVGSAMSSSSQRRPRAIDATRIARFSLPKYEAWPNYNAFLPMNIERYFDFWNRGI